MAYRENGRVYFEDEDDDVLDAACTAESKDRLGRDTDFMWESLGPDALPTDDIIGDDLQMDIADALVSENFERLGRLMAGMALTYAFRCTYDEIIDDWESYIDADDIRTTGYRD